jgi:sugar/nucleoside kinase (ribokinase family)
VNVLVIGSIAFDTIETSQTRKERILGGSANYAAAAASHFAEVKLAGIVGGDYPEEWFAKLAAREVDTSGVMRAEGASFFWEGRYAPDFRSRETLDTRLGVFEGYSPTLPESYRKPRIAFLGNIAPDLQRRVLSQLEPGVMTAMDTMDLWLETARDDVFELMSEVDVFLVNDEEAMDMTDKSHPVFAARELASRGPSVVVVKLGANGAIVYHEDKPFLAPTYPLEQVVDPTGAGDSFAGAFLGSLAAERGIDRRAVNRALVYGAAVASYAVEHFEPAAVLSMQRRDILERFLFIRELIDY